VAAGEPAAKDFEVDRGYGDRGGQRELAEEKWRQRGGGGRREGGGGADEHLVAEHGRLLVFRRLCTERSAVPL
jgi:hypothetical protein